MRRRSSPLRRKCCTVCSHPECARIELLRAGGAGLESIAEKFGLKKDAIWRHWHNHVPAEVRAELIGGPVQLKELAQKAAEENLSLLDYLAVLRGKLFRQFTAATEAGDRNGAAQLSGRLLEVLREIGRLTGELSRLGDVSVTNNNLMIFSSPAFVDLMTTLTRTLAPFPEARVAVITALRDLEARAAEDFPSGPMIEARPTGANNAHAA